MSQAARGVNDAHSLHHGKVLMIGTDPAGRGGIASVVSAYRDAGLFDRFALEYVSTHSSGTFLHKLAAALRGGRSVWRGLASGEVTVLHAHVASRASFARKSLVLALARAFGAKTVFHLHGAEFRQFHRDANGLTRRWIRRTLERSSVVLCLSQSWQRTVQEIAPDARTQVLRNAVSLPPQVSIDPDGHRLLFLGQIETRKGVFVLAEALGLLRKRGVGLTLAAGGVGDVDALSRIADEHGIRSQLELLGWIDPQRRAEELGRASIFVLPSFDEGLPMALLEAMAAGLAVVSTPVGGIPELVIDGEDGLLVPPGDAQALADALDRLVKNPGLRRRLGQAARRKLAQEFAVDVAVDRLTQCYISLGAVPRRSV